MSFQNYKIFLYKININYNKLILYKIDSTYSQHKILEFFLYLLTFFSVLYKVLVRI